MPSNGSREIAHLLVVDDDSSIRQLLSVLLSTEGHDVVTAEDGVDALEVFAREPSIDLVILDVMMPRLDGYGVLERLRGGDEPSDVAVIMLTAKGTKEDELKAQRAGSDGYVTKPFDPDMLIGLIDVTLMFTPEQRRQSRVDRQKSMLPEIGDEWGNSLA